jgi:hypothetical protein
MKDSSRVGPGWKIAGHDGPGVAEFHPTVLWNDGSKRKEFAVTVTGKADCIVTVHLTCSGKPHRRQKGNHNLPAVPFDQEVKDVASKRWTWLLWH